MAEEEIPVFTEDSCPQIKVALAGLKGLLKNLQQHSRMGGKGEGEYHTEGILSTMKYLRCQERATWQEPLLRRQTHLSSLW